MADLADVDAILGLPPASSKLTKEPVLQPFQAQTELPELAAVDKLLGVGAPAVQAATPQTPLTDFGTLNEETSGAAMETFLDRRRKDLEARDDVTDAETERILGQFKTPAPQAGTDPALVNEAVNSVLDDHEFLPALYAHQNRNDPDAVELARKVWDARRKQGWKDKAGRVFADKTGLAKQAFKSFWDFAKGLVYSPVHATRQVLGDEGAKLDEEGWDVNRATRTAETILAAQSAGVNVDDLVTAITGVSQAKLENGLADLHLRGPEGDPDAEAIGRYAAHLPEILAQDIQSAKDFRSGKNREIADDPQGYAARESQAYQEALQAFESGKLTPEQVKRLNSLIFRVNNQNGDEWLREWQDRREFDFDVEQVGKREQLAAGRPLEEGLTDKYIQERSGGYSAAELYGPENLARMGAEPVNPDTVRELTGPMDPVNLATLRMPFLVPGARKIGGAAVEAAGRTVQGLTKLVPGGKAALTGAAGASLLSLGLNNPEMAGTLAVAAAGAWGLKKLGAMSKTMAEIGRQARTGGAKVAGATAELAAARLKGQAARKAWVANLVGNTAVDMATMPVGMAPINAAFHGALPGGRDFDFENFLVSELSSPIYGLLGAANGIKPQLVEAIRPQLRAQGMAELAKNKSDLGKRSADFLASLPEAHRNAVYETAALFQGMEGRSGDTATKTEIYVLGAADYAQVQKQLGVPEGGRGYTMKDGKVYVNGQHRSVRGPGGAGELAHTTGHETGGHAAMQILRAMTGKGGNLYEGLMARARKELGKTKNGTWTPSPEFQRFVNSYNAALPKDAPKVRVDSPEAFEEFISETAGQVLRTKGAAEIAMPEGIRDKLTRAGGEFFGGLLGLDTGAVGGPTYFDRTESGAVTSAYMDAMRRIADLRFRPADADTLPDPGALPEAADATPTAAAPASTLSAMDAAAPADATPAPDAPADPYADLGIDQNLVDATRDHWVSPEGLEPRTQRANAKRGIEGKSADKIAEERGQEFDEAAEAYFQHLRESGKPAPKTPLELEQAILEHTLKAGQPRSGLGAMPVTPSSQVSKTTETGALERLLAGKPVTPEERAQLAKDHGLDPAAYTEAEFIEVMRNLQTSADTTTTPTETQGGAGKLSPEEVKQRLLAAKAKGIEAAGGKKTKAAQQAAEEAEVGALLDLATEVAGEGELRKTTDETGEEVIRGRINPQNPVHRVLLDRARIAPGSPEEQNLMTLQEKTGKTVFIRDYRSAAKKVENEAEGMGYSQKQRQEEQGASTADERLARMQDETKATGESVGQDKAIIPIYQEVTSTGKVVIGGLSPDKLVGNVKKLLDFLGQEGKSSPYRDVNDPRLADDIQAYARNHAHGWQGNGKRQIEGVEADPSYTPQEIPDNRFHLLNAAFKYEDSTASSRHFKKSFKYDTLKAQGKLPKGARKPVLTDKQKAREESAQKLAIENVVRVSARGEVNPLRDWINSTGRFRVTEGGKTRVGTEEILETVFEHIRPDLIKGGIEEAPSGNEGGLRGTEYKGDLSKMTEEGFPQGRYVAAGFMPDAPSQSQVTRTGRKIDPKWHNTATEALRFGAMTREQAQAAGKLYVEPGYAYRTVSEAEVASLREEGFLVPDPRNEGKEKRPRAQTEQKMWSKVDSVPEDGRSPVYGGDQVVLRIPLDKLPTEPGKMARAEDIEVVRFDKEAKQVKIEPADQGGLSKMGGKDMAGFMPEAEAKTTRSQELRERLESQGYKINTEAKGSDETLRWLGVEKDGKEVAQLALGLYPNQKSQSKYGQVESIWVDPDHRRKGIAELLYREAGKYLQGAGYKRIIGDVLGTAPMDLRKKVFGDFDYVGDDFTMLTEEEARERLPATADARTPGDMDGAKARVSVGNKIDRSLAFMPDEPSPYAGKDGKIVDWKQRDATLKALRATVQGAENKRKAILDELGKLDEGMFNRIKQWFGAKDDADILQKLEMYAEGHSRDNIVLGVRRPDEIGYRAFTPLAFMPDEPASSKPSKITESPEFKKWFGGSKVVDEKGEPKVFYHGTYSDFTQFKRRPGDIGLHFGDAPTANDRVDYMVHHRSKGGAADDQTGANVKPVFLAIKNPIRFEDFGFWNAMNMKGELLKRFPQYKDKIGNPYNTTQGLKTAKDIREFLQARGYDGIVYKNTGEVRDAAQYREAIEKAREALSPEFRKKNSFSVEDQKDPAYQAWRAAEAAYAKHREDVGTDSYIAFEPTQIKSATGNSGEFNPRNKDIRFMPEEGASSKLTKEQMAEEAKKLGIRYDGSTELSEDPKDHFHSFTDDQGRSFTLEGEVTAKAIQENLERKRKEFGDAKMMPETPKRKVRAASIRLKDGEVIDAPTHGMAYDQANEQGKSLAGSEEGFTTHEGEFIYRDEALRRFGGSTMEDLKPKKAEATEVTDEDRELLGNLSKMSADDSRKVINEAMAKHEAGEITREELAKIIRENSPHFMPEEQIEMPLGDPRKDSDEDYLKIVDSGDHEKAQEMVDRAAKRAGYTHGPVFHGSQAEKITVLKPSEAVETDGVVFFSDNEEVTTAFRYPREYGEVLTSYYDEATGEDVDIEPGALVRGYLKMKNPLILEGQEAQDFTDDTALQGRIVKQAKADGHDGIIARDVEEGVGEWTAGGTTYAIFDANQVKSADPVTLDKKGKPIPLSQRFDQQKDDIRYMPEGNLSKMGEAADYLDRAEAANQDSLSVKYADAIKAAKAKGYNIIAAHSTNAGDFNEFKTAGLSAHFGTEKAAFDRAEHLRKFSEETVKRKHDPARVIPVALKIENPLRLPDLASLTQGERGEIMDLNEARMEWESRFAEFSEEDQAQYRNGEAEASEFEGLGEEPRAMAWEGETDLAEVLRSEDIITGDEFFEVQYDADAAMALLKEKGYDGIVYKNAVEDEGNDSYIAFDPEQIKRIDKTTDDQGKEIPVSERFDEGKKDMRYMPDDIDQRIETPEFKAWSKGAPVILDATPKKRDFLEDIWTLKNRVERAKNEIKAYEHEIERLPKEVAWWKANAKEWNNPTKEEIEAGLDKGIAPIVDEAATMARRQQGLKKSQQELEELSGKLQQAEAENKASKMETGQPVVVRAFHATPRGEFYEFDDGKLGSSTDAPSASLGHFFAASDATAKSYHGDEGATVPFVGYQKLKKYSQQRFMEELGKYMEMREGRGYERMQELEQDEANAELFKRYFEAKSEGEEDAFVEGLEGDEAAVMADWLDSERVQKEGFTDEEIRAYATDEMNREEIQDIGNWVLGKEEGSDAFDMTPVKNFTHEVFVRMQNPYVHDYQGERYREESYFNVIKKAKELGHDGVILKNTYDGGPMDNIFVTFDAKKNVKAMDAQKYDETNPDIRFMPEAGSLSKMGEEPSSKLTKEDGKGGLSAMRGTINPEEVMINGKKVLRGREVETGRFAKMMPDDGDRDAMARKANFKKWRGKARLFKLEDDWHEIKPGQPVMVEGIHGTTHAFTKYDPKRGHIESDWGKAFYVSNTPEDVQNNYAGEGPDLTSRIERQADQLAGYQSNDPDSFASNFEEEIWNLRHPDKPWRETDSDEIDAFLQEFRDGNDELDGDELKSLARKELKGHGGASMKVYVRMENPLVIGGKEEIWDYHLPEEDDGYSPATGKLQEFMDALDEAARGYEYAETDEIKQRLMEEGGIDGFTPSEAIDIASRILGENGAMNDNGDQANRQIIREALEEMGYDGIIDKTVNSKFGSGRRVMGMSLRGMDGMHEGTVHVIAFKPEQIKSATGNRGTFDPKNPDMNMMPDTPDKNLAAVHNLSQANLRHVLKMGGLAAPSFGAVRLDKSKFDSFGDITLVAPRNLARDAKWYNADIYSPRYPSTNILFKDGDRKKVNEVFQRYRDELDGTIEPGNYTWRPANIVEAITERGFSHTNHVDLAQYAFLRAKGLIEPPKPGEKADDFRERAYRTFNREKEKAGDVGQWVQEQIDAAGIKYEDKIRDGYTNSGNPRFRKHDLETVLKMMVKKIQDGEGFNYGVPSIRANVAKKYNSLEAMGKDREAVIPKEEMEPMKDEASAEFERLATEVNNLRVSPLNRYFLDAISSDFKDVASGREWKYLREQYGDNLTEMLNLVRPFLDKLRNMPTEYFEGKVKRVVQLQEFNAAAVPDNTPDDLLAALKKRGIAVEKYPKGDSEARRAAVDRLARSTDANFMPDGEIEIAGKTYRTGQEVRVPYIRRTKSATDIFGVPKKEDAFDRGYEPSGRYLTIMDKEVADLDKGQETGTLTFKNPLVIPAGFYGDANSWKRVLSQKYGGKTGKALSKAIIADGYDAILTHYRDGHPAEGVDLTSFDERKAKFMPDASSQLSKDLPRAKGEVDGLVVRKDIPNTSSIESSFTDYETLPGVREVPLELFDADPESLFNSDSDIRRARKLAEEIRESGEINPLIIVDDPDGPYVLEGVHRLGALSILGKKTFPALVVKDLDTPAPAPAKGGDRRTPNQVARELFNKDFYDLDREGMRKVMAELGGDTTAESIIKEGGGAKFMPEEEAESFRSKNPHVPKSYRIDPEFNCLTNASNLAKKNKNLRYVEGFAKLKGTKQWGDHAWCETENGEVVDPYFEWRLGARARDVIYRKPKPGEPGPFYMPDASKVSKDGFYSQLDRVASQKIKGRATAEQITATLRNNGVKQEELDWVLGDFLKAKAGQKITPEELGEAIKANQVELKQIKKDGDPEIKEEIAALESDYEDALRELNDEIDRGNQKDWEDDEEAMDEHSNYIKSLQDAIRGKRDQLSELKRKAGGAEAKFGQWQLPGGENYREFNYVLPREPIGDLPEGFRLKHDPEKEKQGSSRAWVVEGPQGGQEYAGQYGSGGSKEQAMARFWELHGKSFGREEYRVPPAHQYGDEADINRIFHLRVNDRKTADGREILFSEEMQSDWHQAGRKGGYKGDEKEQPLPDWIKIIPDERQRVSRDGERSVVTVYRLTAHGRDIDSYGTAEMAEEAARKRFKSELVPDAPFKGNAWKTLALKKLLALAVKEGKEAIGWTTGEQQADRYDLSKQLDTVELLKRSTDGTYTILGTKKGEDAAEQLATGIKAEDLPDYIGKELAAKVDPEAKSQEFSGVDLKVGGEGMRGFYDKELVNLANDLGKKYGAKVEKVKTKTAVEYSEEDVRNGASIKKEDSEWSVYLDHGRDFIGSFTERGDAVEALRKAIKEASGSHDKEGPEIWTLPITEKLREAVQAGQAMFMPEGENSGSDPFLDALMGKGFDSTEKTTEKNTEAKRADEIKARVAKLEDEIEDWEGRTYKANSKTVGIKDQFDQGLSVTQANENRRWRKIERRVDAKNALMAWEVARREGMLSKRELEFLATASLAELEEGPFSAKKNAELAKHFMPDAPKARRSARKPARPSNGPLGAMAADEEEAEEMTGNLSKMR